MGPRKDLSTWDSPLVAEIAFAAARAAELRTVAATAGARRAPRAALERAARELLACRRATGPSWPPASWPATTRASALDAHGADLDAALAALADPRISSAVPEPSLRNLAPDLDLAALTSP